jgi:hypothetical protein
MKSFNPEKGKSFPWKPAAREIGTRECKRWSTFLREEAYARGNY